MFDIQKLQDIKSFGQQNIYYKIKNVENQLFELHSEKGKKMKQTANKTKAIQQKKNIAINGEIICENSILFCIKIQQIMNRKINP